MEGKIPKIIHYCWLSGDPVPKQLQLYMKSWQEVLPDYEFIKWDFTRFDKASSPWVSEAFDKRKYAFSADYIRMYALYTMGGIYLDMDVEVLKSFNDFLDEPYFLCFERDTPCPEMATFGAQKGCGWVGLMLEYYRDRHFVREDGTFDTLPLPQVTKNVLESHGYRFVPYADKADGPADDKAIYVRPYDFFSPKSCETEKINITPNTCSIHRFASSWTPWYHKAELRFWHALGIKKDYSLTWYLSYRLRRLFHAQKHR
ncbi:MAG: glycosyl transferase [Bacteroidales bacterium]|nr:glycosyl transferase [Bacteroidales bacterium]